MRNTKRWWAAWATVLVVYHVMVFALPFPKTPVYFVSYAFTLVALGAQVYVFSTAFAKGAGAQSKFYGWPIARIGLLYLVTQMALGLVFMGLGKVVPVWMPVVLFALMLGVAVIGFLSADAVRDEIHQQDIKVQKNISCIRVLQSKVGSMLESIQDPSLLKKAETFFETLRYSDPVSSEAISQIEEELVDCVEKVQKAIEDNDQEGADALLQHAGNLLAERNRLCKLHKSSAH